MSVKSVYNFVPAPSESEVFKPDWADKVSHDIPFEDGESGEIEIKITAKTPIFIRNGHSKQDAENKTERYQEFSNVERNGVKEYFIPGSSLKGMFRNVLEIVSKSRMSRIDNKRHAVRQIMRTEGVVVDEGYELANDEIKKTIKAGWLIYEKGEYYIYDCGRPMKIRSTDLDEITDGAFTKYFSKRGRAKISENFSARTAKYKYENIISEDNLVHKFENHPLDENDKQSSWVSKYQKLNYVKISDGYVKGSFDGHIVCAGQAAEYDVKTARKGEYVFKGMKKEVLKNSLRILLNNDKFDDFLFLNRTGKSDELEDWGYWKEKIETGIPVFYRTEQKDGRNIVLDFGLTFMYKQFAKNTIKDMEPQYLKPEDAKYKFDFADIVFGTTDGENKLKGRVMFSTCKLEGEAIFKGTRKVVLSTPRSSFFPYYIKQNSNGKKVAVYNTYNTGGELKGFKRYPVRKDSNVYTQGLTDLSDDMKTEFNPLNEASVFVGKVKFHNLRKVEIGALLSAITLHGTNGLFHSIGYAKPLGYGKVRVDSILKGLNYSTDEYIKEFELQMRAYNPNWDINELLSMANEDSQLGIEQEYSDLKEFQPMKDAGESLHNHSVLSKNKTLAYLKNTPADMDIHKEDLINRKKEKEKEKEDARIKKEKEGKLEQEEKNRPFNEKINEADTLFEQEKWKAAKEKYEAAISLKPEESYPKQQNNKCNDELKKENLTLDSLSGLGEFNSDSRKIIQNYFNANKNNISDDDINMVKIFIFRCAKELSGKKLKNFMKPKRDPWKFLNSLDVNEKTVENWHKEIKE